MPERERVKVKKKWRRKATIRAQSVIGINFNKFISAGLIRLISLFLRKEEMFDTVSQGRGPIFFRKDIFSFRLDMSGIIYEFKRRQFGLEVIPTWIHGKRCGRIGDRDYIGFQDFHLGNESNDL